MVVGTIMNVRNAAKSSHHIQNIKDMLRKSIKENGLTGVAIAVKFLTIKNKKVSCRELFIFFFRGLTCKYADGHVYLDRKNKKVKKLIIRAFICTFVHLKMLNHSYDVNYQAIFEIGTSIKQMGEA